MTLSIVTFMQNSKLFWPFQEPTHLLVRIHLDMYLNNPIIGIWMFKVLLNAFTVCKNKYIPEAGDTCTSIGAVDALLLQQRLLFIAIGIPYCVARKIELQYEF